MLPGSETGDLGEGVRNQYRSMRPEPPRKPPAIKLTRKRLTAVGLGLAGAGLGWAATVGSPVFTHPVSTSFVPLLLWLVVAVRWKTTRG
jgi:hypothetical protein